MLIKNKKIINFFNEHKNLDFEETIIKFINIMELLHEKMNNTMNSSVVLDILENLKSMNSKIDTVSLNVVKINENTSKEFSIKMSELKKEYVEELKMVLTCNVSDKIEPLFKEQNQALFSKTYAMINTIIPKNEEVVVNSIERIIKQLQESVTNDAKVLLNNTLDAETFNKYIAEFDKKLTHTIETSQLKINNTLSTTEKRLEDKMENIKEITTNSNNSTNSLNGSLNELLKKFENSSAKGKLSENLILNIIESLYPSAEITSVGQTKETGDILLLRTNKPKILIENKLWGRSVVQAEVVKFIRDIDIQKCCGIFLSQNGKITTKENFEINIHNGNVLVYVHDVHNDPDKIKLAVDIVDHLKEKLDEYEDYNNDQDNISKEMLEYINVEYQNFVSSKSSLVKLAKEFNQKLIKQIEDLKMPSLENYLSSKYSFSSNKFICEFCSFVGKNQQSKSAHIRGCTERKRAESQKNKNIGEQIICVDVEPS
jgi:hypothetical protein